jgi:hypothetical protein
MDISYTEILGSLTLRQYRSLDAFGQPRTTSIDGSYVDGVSVTTGTTSRSHVFTYAITEGHYTCPDDGGTDVAPPSFVGDDYLCDSAGSIGSGWYETRLFEDEFFQVDGDGRSPIQVRLLRNEPDGTNEMPGVEKVYIYIR